MKNFFKIVINEFWADKGQTIYLLALVFILVILEKLGIWSLTIGTFAGIIAASDFNDDAAPDLATYSILPINRRLLYYVKPAKQILKVALIIIGEALGRLLISQAHFAEYIDKTPVILMSVFFIVFIISLYKEIYLSLNIERNRLKSIAAGTIVGLPIALLALFKYFNLMTGNVVGAFMVFYSIIGIFKIHLLFNKRKEYFYFTGKTGKKTKYQSIQLNGR